MNINMLKICLAISIVFVIACNNKKGADKTGTEATVENDSVSNPNLPTEDPAPDQNAGKTDYTYDQTVVITGKISKETFYGAPGYGENPATDAKEEPYLLVPVQKINILGDPNPEDDSKESKFNISKIQLIYDDKVIDMGKYLGSRVELTGTFFGAHTGHHHTPVLMDVSSVRAL